MTWKQINTNWKWINVAYKLEENVIIIIKVGKILEWKSRSFRWNKYLTKGWECNVWPKGFLVLYWELFFSIILFFLSFPLYWWEYSPPVLTSPFAFYSIFSRWTQTVESGRHIFVQIPSSFKLTLSSLRTEVEYSLKSN